MRTHMSNRDPHGRPLCAGKTTDGFACGNLATGEMTFDGIGYCGLHGERIIKRQQQVQDDLKRYRTYQLIAFGAVVAPWTVQQLTDHLAALATINRDDASDLHRVRLDAERDAITREMERRKATP